MPLRSFADVPNRIVRLFLQEAGRQYDSNRGYSAFSSMPARLIDRFAGCCAYCGGQPPPALVEEHLVPMNRKSVGLRAWGNIVPACKACNDSKADKPWQEHPRLDSTRRKAIEAYISEYRYEPNIAELRVVLAKLYDLADRQTRSLIDFGLVASRPYIAGLRRIRGVIGGAEQRLSVCEDSAGRRVALWRWDSPTASATPVPIGS